MTARCRVGTVAVMRSAHGIAAARWRSSVVEDVSLAMALLVAAELEIVLDGLGTDCVALAVLATVPLALRRRLPIVSFVCVAVLTPTLDRALGSPWGQSANALVFVVLAASYSVGAQAPPSRSLPAVVGAMAWLAALEAIWGDGADYVFIVLLLGVPWLSGRGVRKYRHQAARLRELATRLEASRAMSERVAVARERQRMAHEAHDVIAHAVGEMVLQASGAEEVFERDPQRAWTALTVVQETGREAVDELRAVLGILRSGDGPALPLGTDEVERDVAAAPRARFSLALLDAGVALALLALGIVYALDAAAVAAPRPRCSFRYSQSSPSRCAGRDRSWHWLSPRWPMPAKRCSSTATRDRRRRSAPCSSRRIRQQRTRVGAARSPRHASRSARRPRSPS